MPWSDHPDCDGIGGCGRRIKDVVAGSLFHVLDSCMFYLVYLFLKEYAIVGEWLIQALFEWYLGRRIRMPSFGMSKLSIRA